MKNTVTKYTALLGLALLLGSAGGHASIVGSMHDLRGVEGVSTTEVCVFCHTPHGADTSAPAPLWNKVLPDAGEFDVYDTTTLDGQIDLGAVGISLACLSCHDGTASMDLVLNAPTINQGEYRYDAAGTLMGGGISMSSIAAEPVPVLGTNLRDDHPVGVQYAGGGLVYADGQSVSTSANDQDFADPSWLNGRMWVVATDDTRLPLYNGGESLGPLVECGSCHDPHETANGSFLRMSNAGSALCLTCHTK